MAILQGTPFISNGITPLVALMASGQQGIDRGIAMAGRSIENTNNVSNQFIRDAFQQNLDNQRIKLQKEQMASQQMQAQASLSLQERQMAQRSSEFAQTMAMRQQENAENRGIRQRELEIAGIRAQVAQMELSQKQRTAQMQEKMLQNVLGNYGQGAGLNLPTNPGPLGEGVLPPMGDASQEFATEGMPPSLAAQLGQQGGIGYLPQELSAQQPPAPASTSAPSGQPNPQDQVNRIFEMQATGLKMSMMADPEKAGYYLTKLGELEAKRASLSSGAGSNAGEIFQLVDQSAVPFSGLVEGRPTEENVKRFFDNASPLLRLSLSGNEQSWNDTLRKMQSSGDMGDTRSMSEIYATRNALMKEAQARDVGLTSAKFTARSLYDKPGEDAVDNYAKANPHWQMIDKRLAQLDAVIGDGPKEWGSGPERVQIAQIENLAETVTEDRMRLKRAESDIQREWEGLMEGKKKAPIKSNAAVDVGLYRISPLLDSHERAEDFNKALGAYQRIKEGLSAKESNLKIGLQTAAGQRYFSADRYREIFGEDLNAFESAQPKVKEPAPSSNTQPAPKTISRSILQGWDKNK